MYTLEHQTSVNSRDYTVHNLHIFHYPQLNKLATNAPFSPSFRKKFYLTDTYTWVSVNDNESVTKEGKSAKEIIIPRAGEFVLHLTKIIISYLRIMVGIQGPDWKCCHSHIMPIEHSIH